MRNIDKIKAMDIDELAEFLNHIGLCCEDACADTNCSGNQSCCFNGIKRWLESEVRE